MRIAIVAHNAYGMMSGVRTGHIGGVERQTAMLAKWLAGRGHEVSFITWNEGGPEVEEIDGVRVVKACRQDAGVRVLRFFVPRWSSLNTALRVADAELYYQNGAEEVTGQVGIWCRRHRRRFVFSSASDMDCDRRITTDRPLRERLLYRHGLRVADRIIVQSRGQADRLQAITGLVAQVLPMPGEDFSGHCDEAGSGPGNPPLFIMVGRISPEKNMEMFIELARRLPDMRFLVVGPRDASASYLASLSTLARDVQNLDFFGPADRKQLCGLYRTATALCCTSHYEGFPNTFIEAWSLGLPVVSTVDPDGVIKRFGLGAHVAVLDEFRERLQELAASPRQRGTIAKNARAYFLSHHQRDVAMERFESLFLELI
jgi:glycosyltransferase involved in cell wall biosynthesis